MFVFLVLRHHLKKVNKSSGAHFQTIFFSKIVSFLTFFNSHIDFIILKTEDEQFTPTTKKIRCISPLSQGAMYDNTGLASIDSLKV